jgi:transposase
LDWIGTRKKQFRKITKRAKKKVNTNAGQIFRKAAQSLLQSKHIALGAFGRRIRARKGPAIAIKAVARKLAAMFYNLMTKGLNYIEQGVKKYEEQYRKQMTKYILKKASEFGIVMLPTNT